MKVYRLLSVPVLAMVAVAIFAQSPAQLPLDPTHETGQSITGAFEGWFQNADGSYSLLVGYFNRNSKETIEIPIGPNNHIDPGGPDMGQPTTFLPRRQWGVFTIKVPKDFGEKKLTWTITSNGQTTTIPLNINPLWVVTPYKDAGIGNTPPVVKFEPNGQAFTGPPSGIAKTVNTKVKDPLPLTVWVTDDMVRPPEAAPRGGRGLALFWSKFRGPGAVTFSNARPTLEADGKSSTTATFAAPGEYIIRAQANDATGEGGGGFQCCWTNVHVKVTVAATSNQ
jgi:hypothetical protein